MSFRNHSNHIDRRQFIQVTALSGVGLPLLSSCAREPGNLRLAADSLLGSLQADSSPTPLEGTRWYIADQTGDGLAYRFPAGSLVRMEMLSADMLLDGKHMIVFLLTLQEGEDGRRFGFRFSGLNQCSFRVRFLLELVDQNRWGINREGAFLKPRCGGDRVDLNLVDRMQLEVFRKSPVPTRWCISDFMATLEEVPTITNPVLPKGHLIDELGQSTLHEWPAKSRSVEEVVVRIRSQSDSAGKQKWPRRFSRWGGDRNRRLEKKSGFFRVLNDGKRWWLADPDGYAFWSAGCDCVRVDTAAAYGGLETALAWIPKKSSEFRAIFTERPGGMKFINYLAANFIRTFGPDGWKKRWAEVALAELKRMRFNTVGNWSDWDRAREAGFPYVRPMSFHGSRVTNIYRDFPDIYHPGFAKDVEDYARTLEETVDDPAFIGYFLMNEPTWAFSSELPAVGMLFNSPECETRKQLAHFLQEKYLDAAALSRGWGLETDFGKIARGEWRQVLTGAALKDLEEFSSRMVDKYFTQISEACRAVDPNHLNLGMRWAGVPPRWAARGMKAFDVFSINCYMDTVPKSFTEEIDELLGLPVMIGEWHFGALDVGLPSSGIGHLKNQEDRAKAYRIYLEDAAANPQCVGTHWFTLYDESALGRFDGENYNIGFLDVCNRPYDELSRAAIKSHERLYDVASGKTEPFFEAIEYLPKLF